MSQTTQTETVDAAAEQAEQMISAYPELVDMGKGVDRLFRAESSARTNSKKAREVAAPFYKDARDASTDLRESIAETLGKIDVVEAPHREAGQSAAKQYVDKANVARLEVKKVRAELQASLSSAIIKRALGL